jgi:hypothetical protein
MMARISKPDSEGIDMIPTATVPTATVSTARVPTKRELKKARDNLKAIIRCKPFTQSLAQIMDTAEGTLGGFLTLDEDLCKTLKKLRRNMEEYLKGEDHVSRPYNILLAAPPGSGKSHFVKRLGEDPRWKEKTGNELSTVVGNLSGYDPKDTMDFVLTEVETLRLLIKFPSSSSMR